MVRATYRPVPPDQRLRELREEFKELAKADRGLATTRRLAAFARAAHDERLLNMSMHAAQRCLDEDPKAPKLLIEAYTPKDRNGEETIRAWLDLADLGRYVDREDVRGTAQQRAEDAARAWIEDAGPAERRHRLRTVASALGREFADDLADEYR